MHEQDSQTYVPDATRICDRCGQPDMDIHNVLHHLACAYVGPEYDFKLNESHSLMCPKCLNSLEVENKDWEIVGRSYRCGACANEDV